MKSLSVLWKNHPGKYSKPCAIEFKDQCAIRMGETLRKAGIKISSFKGAKCWHGHYHRHILRAEELAKWLDKNPQFFGKTDKKKKVTAMDYQGRKGIIFIKDGWGSGDHIDLWNGFTMKAGHNSYFSMGKEIWFWDLK